MKTRTISISACSEIGKRAMNQDGFVIDDIDDFCKNDNAYTKTYEVKFTQNKAFVIAVTDGMGGESHGEACSNLSIQTTKKHLNDLHLIEEFEDNTVLDNFIDELNSSVRRYLCELNVCGGTTISLASLTVCEEGLNANAFNIGDSPIYALKDGEVVELSLEHTQANYMKLNNLGTPTLQDHSTLIYYLGRACESPHIMAHIDSIVLSQKDSLLICSDGVSKELEIEEIKAVLTSDQPNKAKALVDKVKSKKRKYQDNMTAVVISLVKDDEIININKEFENEEKQS